MKIGIDISSLQGPHRFRGIGYTTRNIITSLPKTTKDNYVFYIENDQIDNESGITDILGKLQIPESNYEIKKFNNASNRAKTQHKLTVVGKIHNKARLALCYLFGNKRYPKRKELDAFIQFDQSKPLPRLKKTAKNYFIAYDLIPYVLESEYLPGYHTRRHQGGSRRSALKASVSRYIYIKKIRVNSKRASGIISISQATKRDYVKYAKTTEDKIHVVPLGVSLATENETSTKTRKIERYLETSWGYMSNEDSLSEKSFLLFVGGADERRRLDDLVAAFNNLKAQGSPLKLVLSGDIMKGPKNIPSVKIREALETSSYKNDIYYLGFTDDDTRNWLYRNALAFVFPSIYEGFGLPVLEAMGLRTSVICYKNRAIEEVAGSYPLYAHDSLSIMQSIKEIQSATREANNTIINNGLMHVKKYSWSKTAAGVTDIIHKD